MKILIITPRIPYPPYRGDKLKIYNISKVLVKNNDVHLFTFYRNQNDFKDIDALKKLGLKLITVKLSIIDSIINLFRAFFKKIPFQVAWYYSRKAEQKINALLKDGNYDLVYYHLIRTAQYLPNYKANTKQLNVIDLTDAVSLYLSRMFEKEKNFIKKIFIKSELNRVTEYEKIIENFDMIFICSEKDKKFLLEKNITKEINILPNGLDISYFSSECGEFDRNRIIFTGNMPYYANSDAVIYFIKEIFPFILKKNSLAKFYIVGQKPPLKIKKLASENVIVTGFVEDIKSEYLKSAVNVAPMRFGAGTLNKIIESLALGVPIVASSIAVGGLPKELSKYILVADNPAEFAEKVLYVLDNKEVRETVMNEAKNVVRNFLSWEVIVGNFEKTVKNKLAEKINE